MALMVIKMDKIEEECQLSESPLIEKIDSKNSIIQRKNVDAKPAKNPSIAASINMF